MTSHFRFPVTTDLGYSTQPPFRHVVLKDAWDLPKLRECKAEIDAFDQWDGGADTVVSRRKQVCSNPYALPPAVSSVITEASSPRFLKWLMELTGEKALLPDPYLEGGGIHRIYEGGFLKVHADFNWNKRIQLYRRLNVLIYLNEAWQESWGGALELWTQDMKSCAKTVYPHMNTMVVFTTDDKSYHGHPHPIECPPDARRDSIALYYYSPIKPDVNFNGERTATNWRPIEGDEFHDVEATMADRIKRKVKTLLKSDR